MGRGASLAQWHHRKDGFHGAAMRAPHHEGIALCVFHHTGPFASIHYNREAFEQEAGKTEAELVALSQKMFNWRQE